MTANAPVLAKTDARREMLRLVAAGRVVLDTERGAWVGPDYKRHMGCYQWASGKRMALGEVEALIELRNARLIEDAPAVGSRLLPVATTPLGDATLARWFQGVASS